MKKLQINFFLSLSLLFFSFSLNAENSEKLKLIKEKFSIIQTDPDSQKKLKAYKELIRLKPKAEKLKINYLLFLLESPEILGSNDFDAEFKLHLADLKKSDKSEIKSITFKVLERYLFKTGKSNILEKRLLKEKRFLDLSRLAILSKNYRSAENLLKKEIKENGTSAEAYFKLGLIYLLDNRKGLLKLTQENMNNSFPKSEKNALLKELSDLANLKFRDKSFVSPVVETIARRNFSLNDQCSKDQSDHPDKLLILCNILEKKWPEAEKLTKNLKGGEPILHAYYMGLIEELQKNRFAKAMDYYKKARENSGANLSKAIDIRLSILEE